MAQKALIIQGSSASSTLPMLSAIELTSDLGAGWRFIAASPFGIAASHGGQGQEKGVSAAILVILERP